MMSGDEDQGGHSHSHSHSPSTPSVSETHFNASGVEISKSDAGLKKRREAKSTNGIAAVKEENPVQGPSKLSAYLNLFGDFVHNMCAFSQDPSQPVLIFKLLFLELMVLREYKKKLAMMGRGSVCGLSQDGGIFLRISCDRCYNNSCMLRP